MKHILSDFRYRLDGKRYNLKQRWNCSTYSGDYKKPKKRQIYKENKTWNASICSCDCSEKCEIRK